MNLALHTSSISGSDTSMIARAINKLGHPCREIHDGVEIAPRSTAEKLLTVTPFADATTTAQEVEHRWRAFYPDSIRAYLENPEEYRAKTDQRLRAGDFTNFWWPLDKLEPEGDRPEQRRTRHGVQLAHMRDVLLPAFFARYPEGRVLRVSYAQWLRGYLPSIHMLKKMRRVGADRAKMMELLGKNSLSELGVHVVPEFILQSLFFALVSHWPVVHGFVATLEHEHFLVFLLPKPYRFTDDEAPKLFNLEPGSSGLMDYREGRATALNSDRVTPPRGHPFAVAESYGINVLQEYVGTFVDALDETIAWITNLTAFPVTGGSPTLPVELDLDYAWHAYLTLSVLVVRTLSLIAEPLAYNRKMTLFDTMDLHAGLIDAHRDRSARAFEDIAHRNFADGPLTAALRRFPGAVRDDLVSGLAEVRASNRCVMADGIIYGRTGPDQVWVPGKKAPCSLDDFEVKLFRALRNTKHGFAISAAEIIAMHTGAMHNDMPDYAIALLLGLFADHSKYALRR